MMQEKKHAGNNTQIKKHDQKAIVATKTKINLKAGGQFNLD